jgi:hypothetical protein
MPVPSANTARSTARVFAPSASAIARFCVDGADEQSEPRARDDERHAAEHERGEHDDEDAHRRESRNPSAPCRRARACRQPSRRRDLDADRSEDAARGLLQDEAHAPRCEQRVERAAVEPPDQRDLEQRSEERGADERDDETDRRSRRPCRRATSRRR